MRRTAMRFAGKSPDAMNVNIFIERVSVLESSDKASRRRLNRFASAVISLRAMVWAFSWSDLLYSSNFKS